MLESRVPFVEFGETEEPCARCGRPTRSRARGTTVPHHLFDPGIWDCAAGRRAPAAPEQPAVPAPRRTPQLGQQLVDFTDRWLFECEKALQLEGGDIVASKKRVGKLAIPLVMELYDATRAHGRINIIRKPAYPDIMVKPAKGRPDQIWEARPSWDNPTPARGPVEKLDVNAAFLSALKCHLPYDQLKHTTSPVYNPKTAGVHLINGAPDWDHPQLPHPMGNREEPGPVWITTATLRLLLRLAKQGLCPAPEILEQWTAPCSESLLEDMRRALLHGRETALAQDNPVLRELVKQMYSKFVSTCGESRDNYRMRRPEWHHNIRAQAFANLWSRAHRAHQNGLQVVHVGGTDELHLVGDWAGLWPNGRGLAEMMRKDDKS